MSEGDFIQNAGNALQTEELIVTDKKIRSQFLEDRTNNLDPYAPIWPYDRRPLIQARVIAGKFTCTPCTVPLIISISYRPCSWILLGLFFTHSYTHHRIYYLVLEYWKDSSYLHFYIFASIAFPQYQITNYSMAWPSFKFIPLIKVNRRSPEFHVQMELVGDFVRICGVGNGRVAMKQFPIRCKLFTHNHVVLSSVLCSDEDPQGFPIPRGSLLSVFQYQNVIYTWWSYIWRLPLL